MLDPNALQQLTQLKHTIRSEKNLTQGTIRGSQGRFGFITLDDGREAFLPPDTMARVLPGDSVEVSVNQGDDTSGSSKITVELEKLISSSTKTLVGKYTVRGKGHFVSVDMPQLSRWIFIPPKARGKAKEGDFLLCRLTRHPFEDGKGQAKVVEVLGDASTPAIEHQVTCRKYNLPLNWSKEMQVQTDKVSRQALEQLPDFDARVKLDTLPFITIDSATTKDMDDALHIEAKGSGWLLRVAIADPTCAIAAQSQLDKAAFKRATSAYLPGKPITMLPPELSHSTFSLVEGEARPALICQLDITQYGEIANYQFQFGVIKSACKLSYEQVAELLEEQNQTSCPAATHALIQELFRCSSALRKYRLENMLLMDEQDDFDLLMDENGHLSDIVRNPHNRAKQVVEEAMLAVNRSAGDLFAAHPNTGIFSTHGGFRSEKLKDIITVLESDLPQLSLSDPTTLTGYRALIQGLQQEPQAKNLLAAFRLMLQGGVLSTDPLPHMGLGMKHYATVTSPIRRYNDLHNHRAIRAILSGTPITAPTAQELADLQQALATARAASRDLEQWLFCLFMEQHREKVLSACVFRVTSQGVMIKLDDWGITGFVKLDPKAFQFDDKRLTLTGDDASYTLNQPIEVTLERIDLDKKRINFRHAG